MLQYKLLKTLCWVKELSHKGQHITWLYSCEEKEAGLKRPEVDQCLLARGLGHGYRWLEGIGVIASGVPILAERCLKQRPSVSLSSPTRLLRWQSPRTWNFFRRLMWKGKAWSVVPGRGACLPGREFTQFRLVRPPFRKSLEPRQR